MRLIKKTILIVVIGLAMSGCSCKTSCMTENFVVKPEDKGMNCQQVIYAINEAEFGMKNVRDRCARPHIFAKSFGCTPAVKLDAAKNQYILSNRIDYLKSLYKLKGCDLAIKLKNGTIAKQASKIGVEKLIIKEEVDYLMNTPKEIIISSGKFIADIPPNM